MEERDGIERESGEGGEQLGLIGLEIQGVRREGFS